MLYSIHAVSSFCSARLIKYKQYSYIVDKIVLEWDMLISTNCTKKMIKIFSTIKCFRRNAYECISHTLADFKNAALTSLYIFQKEFNVNFFCFDDIIMSKHLQPTL